MGKLRKLGRVWLAVFLCICGTAAAQNNAVPFLTQSLSPPSIAPGSKAFTLTVNGTGFAPSAIVNWNGSTRLTEVVSSKQLKASINASDVAGAKTGWITVTNPAPGGGTSNIIYFPVRQESSEVGMAISQPFAGASAVAVGDFNNDGNLDVAWESEGALNVSLGDGTGGFQPPVATAGILGMDQMVVGDFNGDGILDLAGIGPAVTVLLGNGDGTFRHSYYAVIYVGGTEGLATADLAGAGHLDLIVVGWETDELCATILWGNGDGTFTQSYCAEPLSVYGGVPAIGDFNGDGYLDIAVAGEAFGEGGFMAEILLGGPKGGETTIPNAEGNLATADLTGDGKLDLISDDGCVYLGNGDGTFGSCANYLPFNGQITGIGDFNGDQKLDISTTAVAVNLGAGTGAFPHAFRFLGTSGNFGAFGDFNNDGELDIITAGGYLLLQTTADLMPTMLNFGSESVGSTSAPRTATFSNVGSSQLDITGISITGEGASSFAQTNNCGSSLGARSKCTISITFAPKSAAAFTAMLSVSYNGTASPETVKLRGSGVNPATVTLFPTSLSFTAQLVGTSSAAQTATLTNTGDQNVTIASISVSGAFTETNSCSSTLVAGASCTTQIVFAPALPGTSSGTLTVTDNAAGSPQQVLLSGTGTVMSFSPTAVNFGDQTVGTASAGAPITLSNVGSSAVSLTSIAISGTDPQDFFESNACGRTLAAMSSCTITVRFRPTTQGARSAQVTVSDTGGGSPQTLALSGTGT
ncbi:MAG: choice-of-anchor D domain-containing protein [Candidatus Sulfotelmatobacter sp.]